MARARSESQTAGGGQLAAGRARVEDEVRQLKEQLRSTIGLTPRGSFVLPILGIAVGIGLGLAVRAWIGRSGRR